MWPGPNSGRSWHEVMMVVRIIIVRIATRAAGGQWWRARVVVVELQYIGFTGAERACKVSWLQK